MAGKKDAEYRTCGYLGSGSECILDVCMHACMQVCTGAVFTKQVPINTNISEKQEQEEESGRD